MKTPFNMLLFTALLTIPGYSAAYEISASDQHEELCYARAMIGFDSVINSRLGVPAEHALYLAVLNHFPATTIYSKSLLKTIWDAYFWQETPHSYAIKVFYRCATEQIKPRSAKSDWLVAENY